MKRTDIGKRPLHLNKSYQKKSGLYHYEPKKIVVTLSKFIYNTSTSKQPLYKPLIL